MQLATRTEKGTGQVHNKREGETPNKCSADEETKTFNAKARKAVARNITDERKHLQPASQTGNRHPKMTKKRLPEASLLCPRATQTAHSISGESPHAGHKEGLCVHVCSGDPHFTLRFREEHALFPLLAPLREKTGVLAAKKRPSPKYAPCPFGNGCQPHRAKSRQETALPPTGPSSLAC